MSSVGHALSFSEPVADATGGGSLPKLIMSAFSEKKAPARFLLLTEFRAGAFHVMAKLPLDDGLIQTWLRFPSHEFTAALRTALRKMEAAGDTPTTEKNPD